LKPLLPLHCPTPSHPIVYHAPRYHTYNTMLYRTVLSNISYYTIPYYAILYLPHDTPWHATIFLFIRSACASLSPIYHCLSPFFSFRVSAAFTLFTGLAFALYSNTSITRCSRPLKIKLKQSKSFSPRRPIIAAYLPSYDRPPLPFAVLCYATLSVQCSRRAQAEVFSVSLFISIPVSILIFFPSHFHSLTSSPVQSCPVE